MATRTKEKRKVRAKAKSSSSEQTATSRTRADVLELGKHIAAELKLNDRGDWLRHWLAHHVAELVRHAETATDATARREATRRATETILMIWEHRTILPGDANPLSRYREALQVLIELQPKPRQPLYFEDLSRRNVASSIYSRFPRLIEAITLLPAVRAGKRDRGTSKAVVKFLGKDEKTLLSMLELRVRMVGKKEDERAASPPVDDYQRFEEAAHELIDNMIADLKHIRERKDNAVPRRRRGPRR